MHFFFVATSLSSTGTRARSSLLQINQFSRSCSASRRPIHADRPKRFFCVCDQKEQSFYIRGKPLDETLSKGRIVPIVGPFEGVIARDALATLLVYYERDPTQNINLYISSPGGDYRQCIAFLDILQACKTAPITTVAAGMAGGEAALLLASGSKGQRFVLPSARILIHQPVGLTSGGFETLQAQAAQLEDAKGVYVDFLHQFTGQEKEKIVADIDRDCYMSPEEAISYGLADQIGSPFILPALV
mmetsp:Transcript_9585/g.15727  ORF Transcript_9585/g.15727 Transcript_9585/m.15727 type:complete len:245 (+) Transcript_9585:37-771(+)